MEAAVRIIRQLQISELPSILDMAHKFFEEANIGGEFSDEVFVRAWSGFMKAGTGVIFVMTENDKIVGAVGGLSYQDICTGRGTALETFWFVTKEYREKGVGKQLVHQLEQWAKSNNCARMIMAALMNPEFPKMEKFYTEHGYKHLEVNFHKEL